MAKEKPPTIHVDILADEIINEKPHWLDPKVKYSGQFDEDRRKKQMARTKALQRQGQSKKKK
jgi:hypothetical protein